MKNRLSIILMMATCLISFFSCSKDSAEDDGNDVTDGVSLMVKAYGSSGNSSSMTVAKPINIYVFDSADKCVAMKSLASESDSANFKLSAGAYSLYSVAGTDTENYSLPSKDEAKKQSVVALKEGKAHKDIMCAHEDVLLSDGVDTKTTLQMKRKVWMLTDVNMYDVPSNVAEISMSLSPLYENITLSGDYTGANGTVLVSLKKQSDGTTWSDECNMYLLESVDAPLFQFVFKMTDGTTKTFSYVGSDKFVSNYKVGIDIDYVAVSEPTLKCVINGVEWGGDNRMKITISENDLISGDGDDDATGSGSDVVLGEAPEAGSAYSGCYVLKSETSGKITKVTLVAPKSQAKLTYTDDTFKSVIDKTITSLTSQLDVKGWRLPSEEEIKYVVDNQSSINTNLNSHGFDTFLKTAGATYYSYYYEDSDGNIKCYSSGKTVLTPKSDRASYILRPFTTIVFYKQ